MQVLTEQVQNNEIQCLPRYLKWNPGFTLIKLTSLADSVSTKAGFHVGKIAHDLGLGFTCLRLDHPRQPWLLKISKIIWYITISQPEPDRHLIFFSKI